MFRFMECPPLNLHSDSVRGVDDKLKVNKLHFMDALKPDTDWEAKNKNKNPSTEDNSPPSRCMALMTSPRHGLHLLQSEVAE